MSRPIPSLRTGFVACALTVAAWSGSCGPDHPAERGRRAELVILISLDTLRADRLEAYGYERETAPHLARFAEEAFRFDTALAQASQTLLSHKSLLTGKNPLRLLGEATGGSLEQLAALPEPSTFLVDAFAMVETQLAQRLAEAGYTTAAFTDGHWMRRALGFDRGFDTFNDDAGGLARVLPRADGWLDYLGDRHGFLFLHAYDVHCPYVSREPYDSRFCATHPRHLDLTGLCPKTHLDKWDLRDEDRRAIADHYDGGITSADAYLGAFFDRLRAAGRYEEALIIVTSDHGEGLGQHDQLGHGGLYLEQLLVPLLVKLPASWNIAPRTVSAGVALTDLLPTIFEACGVPVPAGLDGRSLLPVLAGAEPAARHLIAQTTYKEGKALDTNPAKRALLVPGRWFLIHDARGETWELYDLVRDPGCETPLNIVGEVGAVGAELLEALAEGDPREDGALAEPRSSGLTEEHWRELEALGYAGEGR